MRYVAAGAIVLIGVINYIGVQRAAVVMTFATVAKYVAVMALGVLAFTTEHGQRLALHACLGVGPACFCCWPRR